MSCRATRSRLALFSGGDLPSENGGAVQRHLDVCAACRQEADDLAAVWKRLLEAPPATFSADELSQVRRGAWRRIESFRAAGPSPALGPSLLRAAGVGAVVLFAAALLMERGRPSSTPAQTAAGPAEAPEPRGGSSLRVGVVADAAPPASPAPSTRVSRPPAFRPLVPRHRTGEDGSVRLEFATNDPQVRIVWLEPPGDSAPSPVEPDATDTQTESQTPIPTEESR